MCSQVLHGARKSPMMLRQGVTSASAGIIDSAVEATMLALSMRGLSRP
jgi:hypothetical protein